MLSLFCVLCVAAQPTNNAVPAATMLVKELIDSFIVGNVVS